MTSGVGAGFRCWWRGLLTMGADLWFLVALGGVVCVVACHEREAGWADTTTRAGSNLRTAGKGVRRTLFAGVATTRCACCVEGINCIDATRKEDKERHAQKFAQKWDQRSNGRLLSPAATCELLDLASLAARRLPLPSHPPLSWCHGFCPNPPWCADPLHPSRLVRCAPLWGGPPWPSRPAPRRVPTASCDNQQRVSPPVAAVGGSSAH